MTSTIELFHNLKNVLKTNNLHLHYKIDALRIINTHIYDFDLHPIFL
jgi:hypothetical protein